MKLLIVPWGRGMGHITRCLAIATQANYSNNHDHVTVVAEESWDSLIKQVGCMRVSYSQELLSIGLWNQWDNVDHIHRSLAADMQLLEKEKPDIVLHDQRPTMPIACKLASIPCAGLAQRADLPDFFYEGSADSQIFWDTWSPAFNTVLGEHGFSPLKGNWRDLLFSNPVLIPSIPEFDPFPEEIMGPQVWYTGPLHLNRKDVLSTPKFERNPEIPIIFVYGVVQTQQDLDQLLHIFREGSFHLIITALPSNIRIPEHADKLRHVSFYEFVNGPTFLPKCDLAIIHGGHGICTSILVAGIPAAVLVDSSRLQLERTNNGKRLEELGVALCVPKNAISERLYDIVKVLSKENIYPKNAQKWQKHLRGWNGPKTAWENLTKLGKKHSPETV